MKPRSWIKTMAVNALSSPRRAFRKANSSPAPLSDPSTSSVTSIPLSMLARLTQLVQFLGQNHLKEEGLYSKPGVGLERKEILRFCKNPGNLPDLSLYSPHSIASAVKEILSEMYAPLVPADISHQLLEAVSSGHIDGQAGRTIIELFKQIRATTREFLQVLLNHLNNLAASPPSRLSVTNLALYIGIALIRPTEDKAILNSKTMMRRRKCVAEFLIRQASELPYDCATEMNIPAIPELLAPPLIDVTSSQPKQLHFIQVTWDAGELSLTFEQLEEMFGKFGEIENLGINDQGNRAIIAYVTAEGAEEAERAKIPNVRIRRRKPRQNEKRREHSPKHSKLKTNPSPDDSTDATTQDGIGVATSQASTLPERRLMQPISRRSSGQPHDDNIVVEDIEDEDEENRHDGVSSQQAHPASFLREGTNTPPTDMNHSQANVDDEDIDSAAASESQITQPNECLFPKPSVEEPVQAKVPKLSAATIEATNPEEIPASRNDSAAVEKQQKEEATHVSIVLDSKISSLQGQNDKTESESERVIDDTKSKSSVKLEYAGSQACKESQITTPVTVATIDSPPSSPVPTPTIGSTDSGSIKAAALPDKTPVGESVLSEQTDSPLAASDVTENEPPNSVQGGCPTATISSLRTTATDALQSKLLDMEKILSTSTTALSATQLSNEFERAVLQLHQQILDMVEECLMLAGVRHGDMDERLTVKSSANAEFLDFLEAQAKTQVKILEVEVRAGQELLRLHKTQHEKERVEFEEEITALRVGRTETERLCAELRADLRKCRSELACHVANATDIQRQRSILEEKLAASDNQLHAKDVALVKLQAEYDKMRRVAAEAQMRAERYKLGEFDESLGNQIEHKLPAPMIPTYDKRATRARVSEDLPQTTKLFSKLSKVSTSKSALKESDRPTEPLRDLETPKTSSRPSNVAALEAIKQQMARDIQDQIASTKAALREMEVCSASGKTLEEEEEELRQLQQQLAAKSSEMTAAMNESRSKLQELLDPSTASPFSEENRAEGDKMGSNSQEPTIFDSTALVNELIARAEQAPANSFNQPLQHENLSIGDSWIVAHSSIIQQPAEYHRPTRDAQSLLYKKWTNDRSRKIAQLATYRDQQAVIQAQQSMQTFQQTLARFRSQR